MAPAGRTSVFKGAFLSVSLRWTDRLFGFISTMILARLLAPQDFGIVAMASLVIGLADVLLDLGVHLVLIQNRNATAADYNTAWTMRLIQGAGVALIIFLSAPYAELYFNDPRVGPVLHILAMGPLLAALENIGIVTFQKEMRFGSDFRFFFIKRISSFTITMLAAYVLQNYWGLVIGGLAGRVVGLILSYVMHPMRPRLGLEKAKEIFSLSQWILIRSIGGYLHNNLHSMLVGRQSNASVMGAYSLASDISTMPTTEILSPLNRVLYPTFVNAKHDLAELKRLFLLAQGVQSLIGIPAGVGLALVAPEAVSLMLGEKWMLAVPFVKLLALANVVEAITASSIYVMITMGRARSGAILVWVQVIIFAISVVVLAPHDAIYIAWLRVITVFIGLSVSVWLLMGALKNVRLLDLGGAVIRPLLSTAIMSLAVIMVDNVINFGPFFSLLAKVSLGLFVYPASVLLMWRLVGKPGGAEAYLLSKVSMALQKRRNGKFLEK